MVDGMAWRKSSFSGGNGNCVEVSWRKSSFSSGNGECVEVSWRKSSFSAGNGACVEVGWPEGRVALRDSKNTDGPRLSFPAERWQEFLGSSSEQGV